MTPTSAISDLIQPQRFVPGTEAHRQMIQSRIQPLSVGDKEVPISDHEASGTESGHESEEPSDDEHRSVAPGQRVDPVPAALGCASRQGITAVRDKATRAASAQSTDHQYSTLNISPIRGPSSPAMAGSFPMASQHPADHMKLGPA